MNVAVLTIVIVAVMTAPILITFAVRRRARTPYEPRHTQTPHPEPAAPPAPVPASQSPDSDVIVASVTSITDRRPA
jgi:hypothetical protein